MTLPLAGTVTAQSGRPLRRAETLARPEALAVVDVELGLVADRHGLIVAHGQDMVFPAAAGVGLLVDDGEAGRLAHLDLDILVDRAVADRSLADQDRPAVGGGVEQLDRAGGERDAEALGGAVAGHQQPLGRDPGSRESPDSIRLR